VIIFLPNFFRAIVRSPSSIGTKITSAEKIPFLSTTLRAESNFGILVWFLRSKPSTDFAPFFFKTLRIFRFLASL